MTPEAIANLIRQMTLEEKISLLHGELGDAYGANQAGHVPGVPRLGIPEVFIADGEYGVDITWDATAFPAKVSLAATFSEAAALDYGRALGLEARDAGMHMILSTRVNIARDPVAQIGQSNGGNFQTLGEDPLLNARLGMAEARGIEEDGNAIANVKHMFGSSTGTAQGALNSEIGPQAMHEIYLLPFEMVIRAGIGSLMTSYNQVNGTWTYRHTDIIDDLARRQWGFDGIVVSDWCCLYSPLAIRGGVSLEMPEGTQYGDKLRDLLSRKDSGVTEADVDRCVRAYLHTLNRFGMLEAPRRPAPVGEAVKRRHIPVARRLAARGAVMLKNNGVLPLQTGASLCVIGPTGAACAMPVFREGAYGFADRKQSPLQALRELTAQNIPFAPGNDLEGETVPAECLRNLRYTKIRYETNPMEDRDLRGLPASLDGIWTAVERLHFAAQEALPPILRPDEYYLFAGEIVPRESGWHRLCLQSRIPDAGAHARNGIRNADMFCFTSGNLYLRQEETGVYRCIGIGTRTAMNGGAVPNSDVVPCRDGWNNAAGYVYLEKGRAYTFAATATNLYHDPVEVRLNWSEPSKRAALIEEAAKLAAGVEVPLVFAWHKSPSASILLQEEQNELIRAVAAQNPRTVVVLNSGDPVAMPWLDDVAAVLEMWYPGQEGGYATADVLLGRADAGGRLPVTFPVQLEDTAPHAPGHPERCAPCGKVAQDDFVAGAARTAKFTEGIYVGYRHLQKEGIRPLFPFGHGLSYARFELCGAEGRRTANGGAEAVCTVRNAGANPGVCVLQGYLTAPEDAPEGVQFAQRALCTFASEEFAPGETKTLRLEIPPESFRYWREGEGWHALSQPRTLLLGFSSEDLPLGIQIQ